MAFIHCLRVNSKFRVAGTSDDWTTQLTEALHCSKNCLAYVSAVSFPVSWFTITAGQNDYLYVATGNSNGWQNGLVLVFNEGLYDIDLFATTLQQKLQAASANLPEFNTLVWSVVAGEDGRLSIAWGTPEDSGSRTFTFASQAQLASGFFPGLFTLPLANELCNDAIGAFGDLSPAGPGENLVLPGLFNSLGMSSCYIHSNLQQYSSTGPAPGDRDAILAIPIAVSYGFVNNWQGPVWAFSLSRA